MARTLIIDDDPKICLFFSKMAESLGHEVSVAETLKEGHRLTYDNEYDVILLDLEFPEGGNGLQILPDLLKAPSAPEVIIVTGTGSAKSAEMAFKYGAWDYVRKPFTFEEVRLPLSRALQYHGEKMPAKPPVALNRAEIIGESLHVRACLEDLARAGATDASALITGETGTGKELFARAIHENSKRSSGNFVTVDCGAIPETLAESTLFGHERGAFTGAQERREGVIVQAEGGTLFLDEIGNLPCNVQKSLLRTIQEKRIRPLGGKQEVSVSFRLVTATNRDLQMMVKEGTFREDLLFRIRAIEISLPPLRDRKEDILEIVVKKIHQLCQKHEMGTKGISSEFMDILSAHHWPGNVRELINILEYSLASAGQDPTLFPKHLPPDYRMAGLEGAPAEVTEPHPMDISDETRRFPTLSKYRERTERDYLLILLDKVRGSREEACRLSGISQSRFYGLLKKHSLPRFSH